MKQVIVKVGYNYLRFTGDAYELDSLIKTLASLDKVDRKHTDNGYIFSPDTSEGDDFISVIFTEPEQIRPQTKEEKENTEIAELKNSRDYYSREYNKKCDECGKLKCKISVLEGHDELPTSQIES